MSGAVSVSIVAGPIKATGNGNPASGHQIKMGDDGRVFIHLTPEVAAQWLPVIQKIAEESN